MHQSFPSSTAPLSVQRALTVAHRFLPLRLLISCALLLACACQLPQQSDDSPNNPTPPRFTAPQISYRAPQILNGSQWDPKEKQRSGLPYSETDFSNLRRNGAQAYIARTGKGNHVDPKAATFLKAADQQGMLLGAYHYYLPEFPVIWQADRFVERVQTIGKTNRLHGKRILLVADFDSKTTANNMLAFLRRIEQKTGIRAVVYLENHDQLRRELRNSPPSVKNALRRYPLWIALYNHVPPPNSLLDKGYPITPEINTRSYGVWEDYALWQYGGVLWENRRSTPKVYQHAHFQAPAYFGNLDRPTERSVFKGKNLKQFWINHSLLIP